jgi:formylglycine-generating enzyme required for sulfatase activity
MPKSYLLFGLLLLLSEMCRAQAPAPPNCIAIAPGLFMDQTEITNLNWLEYLYYLNKDSTPVHYRKALPDSTVWLNYPDTVTMQTYLQHPAYRYFPVIGISYEQAVNYSRWRTAVINHKIMTDSSWYHRYGVYRVLFRLPTEEEWMLAAKAGGDQDYGTKSYLQKPVVKGGVKKLLKHVSAPVEKKRFRQDLKKYRKHGAEPVFNVLKYFEPYFYYGHYAPVSVNESPHTTAGEFRHMIGNVAEMILIKGISKGGSWAQTMEESKISTRQHYSKPAAWLGFRCACELIPSN